MTKNKFILIIFIAFYLPGLAQSKVDTSKFVVNDTSYFIITHDQEEYKASIQIYVKKDNDWDLFQQIDTIDFNFVIEGPKFSDLNNDGKQDFKIYYSSGARGANELYHVFLWSKGFNNYSFFEPASGIPNFGLNNKGVLEGVFFTGSTTYIQYKIDEDSLVAISKQRTYPNEKNRYTIIEYYLKNELGKMEFHSKDSVNELSPMPLIPELKE